MKLILILSALLLLFNVPAFSELTPEDIKQIRSIVRDAVNASEQRMKAHISQEIAIVNVKILEMDKRLTGELKALDKQMSGELKALDLRLTGAIETLGDRLDHIFMLVLALVAFVGVVIGIPQIIVAMQRKDIRAQDEKIEMLQKQVEGLLQEIETRNQERIVSS